MSTGSTLETFSSPPPSEVHHRDDIIAHHIHPEDLRHVLYSHVEDDLTLPPGVGLIGGAARNLAWVVIRNEDSPPLRDVDVAYLPGDGEHVRQAQELAARLSPRDFEHGHGAQYIDGLAAYMGSRDFTCNQVVYVDGKLFMTADAERDIQAGIIRPLESEYAHTGYLNDRLRLKGYLLETVLRQDGHDARFDDPNANMVVGAAAFDQALILQKALEYGKPIADRFFERIGWKGEQEEVDYGTWMIACNRALDWPFHFSDEVVHESGNSPLAISTAVQAMFSGETSAIDGAALTGEARWSELYVARLPEDDTIERQRSLMGRFAGRGSRYTANTW